MRTKHKGMMFPGGPCLNCEVTQGTLWHRSLGGNERDFCQKCREAGKGLGGSQSYGGGVEVHRRETAQAEAARGEANTVKYPSVASLFYAVMVEGPELMAGLMLPEETRAGEAEPW